MFNYFTVQQLPNFVLAAPVLLLWAAAVIRYGRADPLRFVSGILLLRSVCSAQQARMQEDCSGAS